MNKKEGLLDKSVSVRSMGAVLGGTLVMAIVSGMFWHRRAIKRLIEISRM